MPEGPSLILTKEKIISYKGKRVAYTSGITKTIHTHKLLNKKLTAIRTYGKELLLHFGQALVLRVHFGMYGSVETEDIDRPAIPRLRIAFDDATLLLFYVTSLRFIDHSMLATYTFSTDILSTSWSSKIALEKLAKAAPTTCISDLLLDQNIFAGCGNIIKNEALFTAKIDPRSTVGALPVAARKSLVAAVVAFAKDFLKWLRKGQLTKHLQVYEKKACPICNEKLVKEATGAGRRASYRCAQEQRLYV